MNWLKIRYPYLIKATLFLLSLLFTLLSKAQQPYIPFQHFSSVNGLSQNQVLSIFQDRKGFIWLGTLEGLNRFDGYDFKVYNHRADDSSSLSHDFATVTLEDREGVLWVGTGDGLSWYDRTTDSFHSFKHNSKESSISAGLINQVVEDKRGNFWIAFATGYVDYFDPKKGKFDHFLMNKNFADVTSLQEDRDGNLWIGTQAGITVMDSLHHIIKHFEHEPSNPTSLSNNYVNDIYQSKEGTLWIATDEGVNKYDPIHHNFIRFTHNEAANSLNFNVIKCIAEDKQGRLWIGTENKGLDIWDQKKNQFYHYLQNESDKLAISDNSIYSIFKDKHDNMWVGTNSHGVNFYDASRKPFVIYQHIAGQSTSLSHNKVNAVAEQPNKGFWVATDGGGLNFFDENRGVFTAFRHDAKNTQSLPSDFVVDVLWDPKDECVWVATWGGGLAKFDPKSGKFRNYQHKEHDATSIASNNLWRLYEDKQGFLYAGTVGNGLSIFNKATSTFTSYGPKDGLADENVVSIYRDSNGFLWLGSWGNGLSRIDLSSKNFVSLPAGITIKSNESITGDSLGRIWISGNPGIQCYNPKDNTVSSLTDKDGLPKSNVNGIIDDTQGNFWLTTNKGIVKFNLAKKESTVFSEGKYSGRLLRASNGKMYFGSVDGLIVFHPDSIKRNLIKPPVIITELRIFNKPVIIGASNHILKKSISETKEIWLPYEYNFITMSFVALSYTSPGFNQYSYKLENFDNDWIQAEHQRSATYTSLDPGDYEFKVRASNNDGVWNEQGVSLRIHVLPPWWQTYWFRALILAFAGFFIFGFYRFRVRSIENQNVRLIALVTQRTKELKERQEEIETQNEELKQSQEEISSQRDILLTQNLKLEEARTIIEQQNEVTKLHNENLEMEVQSRTKELLEYNHQLEQFAFISAHNLRSPVARILGLGNVLDLTMKDPVENRLIYQKMVATAHELDRVVRDLNTILEIRRNNTSHICEIDFNDVLAKVKLNSEKDIEDTDGSIQADFSKAPTVMGVKPYVESVMQNLVSNALKYKHPHRHPIIQLTSEQIEGFICLTVTDNGLGIDTALFKDKIFTLYQRFHNHVEGKGLGLYLIKTQIHAMGGKIELTSQVNVGTSFKVYFKSPDS